MNARRVEVYNIFKHSGFLDACQKALNTYDIKEEFLEVVRTSLLYYFWSKREWEVEINDLGHHPNYPGEKVDVYKQVMINWDIFTEYLWLHKNELNET